MTLDPDDSKVFSPLTIYLCVQPWNSIECSKRKRSLKIILHQNFWQLKLLTFRLEGADWHPLGCWFISARSETRFPICMKDMNLNSKLSLVHVWNWFEFKKYSLDRRHHRLDSLKNWTIKDLLQIHKKQKLQIFSFWALVVLRLRCFISSESSGGIESNTVHRNYSIRCFAADDKFQAYIAILPKQSL